MSRQRLPTLVVVGIQTSPTCATNDTFPHTKNFGQVLNKTREKVLIVTIPSTVPGPLREGEPNRLLLLFCGNTKSARDFTLIHNCDGKIRSRAAGGTSTQRTSKHVCGFHEGLHGQSHERSGDDESERWCVVRRREQRERDRMFPDALPKLCNDTSIHSSRNLVRRSRGSLRW